MKKLQHKKNMRIGNFRDSDQFALHVSVKFKILVCFQMTPTNIKTAVARRMSLPIVFLVKRNKPTQASNNKTKQVKQQKKSIKFVSLQLMVPILSTQNPALLSCRKQ